MASRFPPKILSIVVLACTLGGCSEGATLVRESPQGGIVTYLYQDDRGGPMFSRHRNDALAVIAQKCPSGYSIVQESEARGTSTVQGTMEGTEDNSRYRRWGLQFRCKESSRDTSKTMKGQP